MPHSALSSPAISGTTDVYLILGDPVEQVRAPESFNPIFASMGIDAVLVPVSKMVSCVTNDWIASVRTTLGGRLT